MTVRCARWPVLLAFVMMCCAVIASACASSAMAPGAATNAASPTVNIGSLGPGLSTTGPPAPQGMATIHTSELPSQARQVLGLIEAGGPFPYSQDGVVFENREKLLPKEASGYYHEYTVPTPGSSDRGARRIITGKDGERYYTDDHYDSFSWIVP